MKNAKLLLAAAMALTACGGVDHLGRPPSMTTTGHDLDVSRIVSPERAALAVPAPEPARYQYQQGSLFASSQNALVGDRRAKARGDILTIVIDINETAEFRNQTDRNRSGSGSMSIGSLFGLNTNIEKQLAGGATLDPGVEYGSQSRSRGQGTTRRSERLSTRVAATVVDVLPNGHLVIQGDQEVRVNYELRDVRITGIVRPDDINRRNEVGYDKIAGARIAYGGRGQIMDLQQPRIGQQITDMLTPF
jgi:flagellar L-ring protein FlgH